MTIFQYILLMLLGTGVSSASLFLITASTSPQEAGVALFSLLYVSVFCIALGISSLLGLIVRLIVRSESLSVPQKVERSFRQGVLFALLSTATLILKGNDMLTWWNSLLLVGAVSSIEMAFMGLASGE